MSAGGAPPTPIVWPAGPAVQLTRRFPDAPATLFRAFTDPAALQQWWGPRDFAITAIAFPAEEGRDYRVELRAPDGSRWAHEGRFLEVRPPTTLAYTWRWVEGPLPPVETLVELTFRAEGAGTVLSVRHGPFADQAGCDRHVVGWTDTFARLEAWARHSESRRQ
ncbi:MAG: SRPBCC domain-containing protein [Vicinamibacterales bacterium]